MPTTRREFIQRFGIMLVSLLAVRCVPAPSDPMATSTTTPVPTATPTPTIEPTKVQVFGVYQVEQGSGYNASRLELRSDHTFTYQNRGDSCWLWRDHPGTWCVCGDTLIFTWHPGAYSEYSERYAIQGDRLVRETLGDHPLLLKWEQVESFVRIQE